MKKKKLTGSASVLLPVGILVLVLVLLIVVAIELRPEAPKETVPESTPPNTTVTVSITYPPVTAPLIGVTTIDYASFLSWEPMSFSDEYVVNGETLIFSSINYPQFSGGEEKIMEKINEQLRAYGISFATIKSETKILADEDRANAAELAHGFEPYEFAADYHEVFIKGSALSIRFLHAKQMGGANTYPVYDALCFDLTTGDLIDFAQFIGKDEETATDYIVDIFSQKISGAPQHYHADVLELLPTLINLYSFYLSEEGVTYFFNPEVISPSVFGIQSQLIPYEHLS